MSLPNPERDALELTERPVTSWPKDIAGKLNPGQRFRLTDGPIYLLGVSSGAGMRREPALHIAVFGLKRSRGERLHLDLLPKCRFGALVTRPEKKGDWHWAESLKIISVGETEVRLEKTGQRVQFRPA